MIQSFIGNSGYGFTPNVLIQAQINRANGVRGEYNGKPQINPDLKTPLSTQMFGRIQDKLNYLHGEEQAAKIDSTKAMFREAPLQHTIDLNTRFANPYDKVRLYATDE